MFGGENFSLTFKKKLTSVGIVVLILFLPGLMIAEENGFGLGVILGEPTGIGFKKWIGNSNAIDGGIAWSFVKESSFHLHVDYLFHNFNLMKAEKGKLPIHYGIGFRFKADKKSRFGVRFPVGISYIFEKTPLDIFLEIGPLLDLIPGTEFGIMANIGFRYYFR
jgi:hypothetical protein